MTQTPQAIDEITDFSQTNPSLHRLYVVWAQHDLQIINKAIETIGEVSRVDMNIIAGVLHDERAKIIRTNAAWQEACWRLLTGDLLEEEANAVGEMTTACKQGA